MKTINLIILAFALIWGCTSRSSNISSSHNVPDSLDPTLEVENIGKDLSQEGGVSKNNTIIIEDHRNRRTTNEVIKSTKLIDELSDSLVSMAKTAEKFIKWYISDSSPIDQDKLITYSDPLGYYIFDTNYGEYYLNEFQNTEIVSDSLIQWLKNVFEQSKADYEYEKISLVIDKLVVFTIAFAKRKCGIFGDAITTTYFPERSSVNK